MSDTFLQRKKEIENKKGFSVPDYVVFRADVEEAMKYIHPEISFIIKMPRSLIERILARLKGDTRKWKSYYITLPIKKLVRSKYSDPEVTRCFYLDEVAKRPNA